MKLFYFGLLLAVICINLVNTKDANYENYTVYRVFPKNGKELKVLDSLQKDEGLDFWTELRRPFVDIMVSPNQTDHFQEFMYINKFDYSIFIKNVQRLIDNEVRSSKRALKANKKFSFDDYYRLDEINEYLASLEAEHSQVKVVVGGESYEGRNITGVNVSYKSGNPLIVIEGGIHAREWIAPATVLFLLTELLTSTDPNVRKIAENYDWYFFPSVNPDGYEYTHTNSRLWRKTRKPYTRCTGADANRNFDFHWNEVGSSNQPCAETYAGPSAFSEIEAKSFSEFVVSKSEKLWAYIGFHSYSQLLLFPYGHTPEHLDNYDDLLKIGNKAGAALAQKYGTQYTVGAVYETIYGASGSSMDWVKATLKIPIAYTYELRDTGRYGFLLPAEQIVPNGEEVLDSLVTIVLEAQKLGY